MSTNINPPSNVLPEGVSDDQLRQAVVASGYPLQAAIVEALVSQLERLKGYLSVQEEWSYEDKDAGVTRNLDAYVDIELTDSQLFGDSRSPLADSHFRCHVSFLIECKQSNLPFVFFEGRRSRSQYPMLFGLPNEWLKIVNEDDERAGAIKIRAADALGLSSFDHPDRRSAILMSKAVRKGKDLELTGEISYKSIVLPLLKATHHFFKVAEPSPEQCYRDIRVVFPVAVLRAPMVSASADSGEGPLQPHPWFSLSRVEPGSSDSITYSQVTSFDIVHEDYFNVYVDGAVGLAAEILSKAVAAQNQLITGKCKFGDEDQDSPPSPPGMIRPVMSEQKFQEHMAERIRAVHDSAEGSLARISRV